jgi:hypothetical protein
LRCVLLNVQGLVTKRINKLKSELLINIFKENDIIMFTETSTNEFSDIYMEGFEHYVLNRTLTKSTCKRNSGGEIIYVKNYLVSENTLLFTSRSR